MVWVEKLLIANIGEANSRTPQRAMSLFEATNPETGKRYEVQLKGAGLTPYSRFAYVSQSLFQSWRFNFCLEMVKLFSDRVLGSLSSLKVPCFLLPHYYHCYSN